MWCTGKLSRSKQGAGSIIGGVFILLILFTGFTFYVLHVNMTDAYTKTVQDMQQLDLKRNKENIEFISVSINPDDKLNITVKNTGSYQVHLIWLGIFNETATPTTQRYYELDTHVEPAETVTNIPEETITILEDQELVIQLVTELGNAFSYPISEEYVYDFVDKTCDLYAPSAKGNHSLFSAQQAGPDGICYTLTEESTGGAVTLTEYSDSQNLITYKDYGADQYLGAECHKDTWVSDNKYFYFSSSDPGGDLEVQLIYETTIKKSGVVWIYVYSENRWEDDTSDIYLDIWDYDDSSWVSIITISYSGSDTTQTYNITSSASEFMSSEGQMKIRYYGTGTGKGKRAYLDHVYLKVGAASHEIDLEVQWTNADYDETNEYLCIYAGTMDAEDILVDVWNGTAWINVFTDLSSGWNSADVSSYLVSSTFTIRFRGGTETGDTTQSSWEIDATFLYAWT